MFKLTRRYARSVLATFATVGFGASLNFPGSLHS
jgi:hypothetical protein